MDGDSLASALQSGIHRVFDEQETLNRINVFPVADGDTGTNLSLSLGAALGPLTMPGSKHLGTLLVKVADALLDGARGNSGAIVAQFFQGMSDSIGEAAEFSPRSFSDAVNLGNEYAHDALADPKEGTILSVIAVFAKSLEQQTGDADRRSIGSLLDTAIAAAQKALTKTQEQLDVLRKAGVVDAGAKGFVAMLEGIAEFLVHGRIAEKPALADLHLDAAVIETAGEMADLRFRFCTECIVTGNDIDRRKLRESLADLGDSLVLAGTKRKAKVHIHVNSPEDVFELARHYGDVSGEKSDDMHRQQHSTHEIRNRFAVITDSAADISDQDMERLDIHMVPVRIQFGDRGYLDKVSITAEEFFEELARNPVQPTTSQPSPGDFRRQFQFLASHFPDVISINLMPSVSGTLQAARSAAERTNAGGEIHVVDSRNASLGEGLIAVFAAECAQAGLDTESALTAQNDSAYPYVRPRQGSPIRRSWRTRTGMGQDTGGHAAGHSCPAYAARRPVIGGWSPLRSRPTHCKICTLRLQTLRQKYATQDRDRTCLVRGRCGRTGTPLERRAAEYHRKFRYFAGCRLRRSRWSRHAGGSRSASTRGLEPIS
jgi:hypothetical protein